MKIVLDYGHCLSGADTGASGNGYREEVCTREIGKKVRAKLENLGHYVVVVSPDYALSVSESLRIRVSSANSAAADISVSIHLNAGGGRGTEIYTKGGSTLVEASNILKEMNIDGLELELISEASLRYTVDKKTFLPIDSDIIIKFDLNHGSKEGIAINVKYSNINNVKEIILPKEVLEARINNGDQLWKEI